MPFQAYTCGFMVDRAGHIVLVEKRKPAWQAGKLNGVGGKIEINETPHACMRREWLEETGHRHDAWDHLCSLQFPEAEVHFFRALVDALPIDEFGDVNDSGERIMIAQVQNLPETVIDNLRWLIPLSLDRCGNVGGKIHEESYA